MTKLPVPVIMYHSIGIPNKRWQWNYLTCPYDVFEKQLKWLKIKKFNTISLQQLYDYMNEGVDLPINPIVLTFDDGYLDNWVFAYPLLKKYGFKGTIYVNPEFADSRNIIRNNLEDVWSGDAEITELDTIGYLSWTEMKKMEKEGIVDIQAHTMTHTWYPVSGKIIDFRHPMDPYTWMTWNNHPDKKHSLQIDNEDLMNCGEPVYQHGRAIGIKRFFPDTKLKEYMVHYVNENNCSDIFKSDDWRSELFDVVNQYTKGNQLIERFETDHEYEVRLHYELQKSKEIIEEELQKNIHFLCWAGGAISDKAIKVALDAGYISSTAAKDMKHERKYLKNKYGENPSRINRIGPVMYWDGIEGFGSKIKYKNGFHFVLSLYRYQERIIAPLYLLVHGIGFVVSKIRCEIFNK